MNSKISKIGAVVLTVILFGTAFFVPVSSVKIEQNMDNSYNSQPLSFKEEENLEPFILDRSYNVDTVFPLNLVDNDDAGYKRDAGDEISRSNAIYPGEMIDDWPGRGNTGKLSSTDDEDWYFFSVCDGQDIIISMTPPTGHDYDLGLWNNDEVELATSTNTGSTTESITYTATETGRHYMCILYISGTDEGQYTFSVTLSNQNDAGTSSDAGDDFASATTISPGTYTGYLDMDDEEDWYKFSANSGQGIHLALEVNLYSYLSDFDLYLYDPDGELRTYDGYYYDDEVQFPADKSGQWRIKIKIFPGYTDIPSPTEWDYVTYGSGAYEIELSLEGSATSPPGPIPQPNVIPIAQTFKITNAPDSNVDEYGYLASIPACNYLEGGNRYLAPIVYSDDPTPTQWYGTVDDTTDYLLDDWNEYLSGQGKTATEFYVNSDPVKAAAEIATEAWDSSDLAVIAVDGSTYEDTTTQVLYESATLPRNAEVESIPNDSPDFIEMAGSYAYVMYLGNKWGAINIKIAGDNEFPLLMGIFPHYMTLAADWWPEHVTETSNLFYPITTPGIWAASVGSITQTWNMIVTKLECDRYKIDVDNPDSALTVKVTTSSPNDLLVMLVDPEGNIMAPDVPDWNGGPINPIHEWNGIDDPDYSPDCTEWQDWVVEDHTEFTAEVLHPEKGEWTAIVVPRYATGSSNIAYTVNGKIREISPKRADAAISAANAAVIASQEHVPLLYVTEDSIPAETQSAIDTLGISNVIFVQRGNIGSAVEGSLPTIDTNLKTMQQIVDYIKDYSQSENYITITSLKTGDGYFAPSAMLAAYHCSPVLRIDDAEGIGGGSPAIIGKMGDNMYCYDPDSEQFIWNEPLEWTPIDPNPNPLENSVYLGSTDDIIYCVDSENFGMLWSSPVDCENVFANGGSLYYSLSDKNIHCIDGETGDELFYFPLSDGVAKGPASMANQIDTWRTWEGDYYHGNRAPGHLPTYTEPIDPMGSFDLLMALLDYLTGKSTDLPPWGLDAKRYWNEKLYNGVYNFINDLGLDLPGQEAFCIVAPRNDIRLELHAVLIGNESYAGHIPGDTPAYSNDVIMRDILYPAIIFANPNRDVTTTQFMNYPDGESWRCNDGVSYPVYSSRIIKKAFMSHGRTYEGHTLWEAHLERMNNGASVFYYSGHGTGGSGMSAQYYQTDNCNYPEQIWYDAWRGYMYDNWKIPRDNGRRWFNPEPPNLYDIIHYKWIDQLFENIKSAAIFYMSCSTGQQFAPMVYLDHGALMWYGNAGSGLCPQADLLDDWMFEECLINGLTVGAAFSKNMWLHQRDFTTSDPIAMYGSSSLYGDEGITTIPVIYGDPNLILFSPEWTEPVAVDSVIDESDNAQPLAPTITGPSVGKKGTSCTFSFVTTDPDGDDISYYVDWGDGATEDWDGPYASGKGSSASHAWSTDGVFNVKVKARDSNGLEGPWGVHQISMPRAKVANLVLEIIKMILQRFPIIEQIITKLLSF